MNGGLLLMVYALIYFVARTVTYYGVLAVILTTRVVRWAAFVVYRMGRRELLAHLAVRNAARMTAGRTLP